jgi:hypothetical protein
LLVGRKTHHGHGHWDTPSHGVSLHGRMCPRPLQRIGDDDRESLVRLVQY